MKRSFTAVAGALAAFALVLSAQPRTLNAFFDDFTARWIRANPDQAISTRYFTGPEQARLERELTPQTEAWRQSRVALARDGLTELRGFDRSRFNDTERVSADLMDWQLGAIVEGDKYADYLFPLEQFQGANVNLVAALTISHPLNSDADANSYIARLGQVGTRMDEAVAEAKRMIAKGLFPPRFIVQATIDQMQQFLASPPAQNPFVSVFADRLSNAPNVSVSMREALRSEAVGIVSSQIYPAWRRAVATLEPLLPRAIDDAGLWRLPGGPDAYAYFLRRYTTTDLTADQIHEIGLREVARLEQEMDGIFRQMGRSEGSVKERIEALKKELRYPLTDDGRKAIMADVEQILRDSERRSTTMFARVPKARVVAQPFPRFREANAAASYTAPAPDGSRPGTFQIPLRPDRMTKFGLRSLVYHETVPGHHFQIGLEMEDSALPTFRRIRALGGIPALGEGWGLYAERLAAESGWYDDDLPGRLGELDAQLFRARRLVVDTGIHAKHWTRQQAIDYGIEPSEVERYVVYPGQACAYMLGELKIVELREKARAALGDRFAIEDFHDAVLRAGTVPLDILARQVDAYIKSASGR